MCPFSGSMPAEARLLNEATRLIIDPEVVSDIFCMTPDMAFVEPAIPSEPSRMPFVRMSIASWAGTIPAEIIFCISSVGTSKWFARICRPWTPPTASWLMVSRDIFPVAIACPAARDIWSKTS